MAKTKHNTACYKIIAGSSGNQYRFFCASSGAAVYTSEPIAADTWESELTMAWESGARQFFNQCKDCGRWVCNTMYNPDMLACVDCAPWEKPPRFCTRCGAPVKPENYYCTECGLRLTYGGEVDEQKE